MELFDLSQAVSGPTQKKGHTLDLILYRETEALLMHANLEHDLRSDHTAVSCKLDVPKPSPKLISVTYRRINNINNAAFRDDLDNSLPITSSVSEYNNVLQSILDKHAPLTERSF